MSDLVQRLTTLSKSNNAALLTGILRGIEKESLRITPDGELSQEEHPKSLGSTLTHPRITTDYSEALLEFITEPLGDVKALLQQLDDIHRFTYANIDSETLWVSSMPCMLSGNENIPVGLYGSSNIGRMKTVYRLGLGERYGRLMQTIAGIHYNFSLPDAFWEHLHAEEQSDLSLQDFKTQRYFDLIRNFRRYFWILIYLFGAAPAVCRSFVRDQEHQLEPYGDDKHSLHLPYGTSLRMGNLGYQSAAQEKLIVCYNNLGTYIRTLCNAITDEHPDYSSIGLKADDGGHKQLNTSLLQIENEFYSTIRPKRTSQSGETALNALADRGVEYIEVRCVDLNPYEPLGINEEQIRFLDSFLMYCLYKDSPATDKQEFHNVLENQTRIVARGRDPELKLLCGDGERDMRQWATEILGEMGAAAELLDQAYGSSEHADSLAAQADKLENPDTTPSARILADMKAQNVTFFRLAMNLSQAHKTHFTETELSPEKTREFEAFAKESHAQQQQIEAQDEGDFESFLAAYYKQYQGCSGSPC
mgnify:CR=1 FL=1